MITFISAFFKSYDAFKPKPNIKFGILKMINFVYFLCFLILFNEVDLHLVLRKHMAVVTQLTSQYQSEKNLLSTMTWTSSHWDIHIRKIVRNKLSLDLKIKIDF